ncbi:uncharacterized protein CMU_026480 [Cryptosporidium muris RN66]|uniref:Uncharacterized protein n=1 Tax=Cryptosporidium muris (strain RN66) TaxID=441375 RepID=B6AB88_CRYMR|nr:uncharacterized protein CMU_026480 [Cryptosporidium muris RN66]EEA05640.1 hypothetical protein, conserved [Cryptosporidium muris RN66]|eukprot:XP_002139989.1 hypothetical protein [Cryptosporidium muris RN66]
MCSLSSAGFYSVSPSNKCRKFARQLKFLLILEFVTLLVLFILVPTGGTVWVLLQVFSIILAYIAIKDSNAYRPPILQIYIFITALGTLFCAVYFAVSVSIVKSAISIAACSLFAVNVIVLAFCTRVSWLLFKELMLCSPLLTGTTGPYIFGSGISGRVNNEASVEMSGTDRHTNNNEVSRGFVPFGGEGFRLSSNRGTVSNTDGPITLGSNNNNKEGSTNMIASAV